MPRQLTATKTSHEKWIHIFSVSIVIIPTRLLCQMQANSSGAEFLSTISKFMKRMNFAIAFLRPSQNLKLGTYRSSRAVDGKEMYKKAWFTCKVVVLPCQAIAFFTFSSPLHLKLPIIYDTLWSFRNRIFSVQIAPAGSIRNVFRLIGVVPSFWLGKLGERTGQLWRDNRELKQRRRRRQRERQKSNRFRLAKQQLCTCFTLFCTFLCSRCTTTTWKCLNSRFVEDGNTRQQLPFSFPERLWYSPLEFNSKNISQHLTNWTRWKKRDKVWSSADSLSCVTFLSPSPSLLLKLPNSRRVRTHEKNLGETVRRLGTIIQSIFRSQSGVSIHLTVWKWSGESRYPGALSPMLENFRRVFSLGPTDCPWVSEDALVFNAAVGSQDRVCGTRLPIRKRFASCITNRGMWA